MAPTQSLYLARPLIWTFLIQSWVQDNLAEITPSIAWKCHELKQVNIFAKPGGFTQNYLKYYTFHMRLPTESLANV